MLRWRKVNIRKQRTAIDWALEVKELLTTDYPNAKKIIFVCDNLNTHTKASLYKIFVPQEARMFARRLEMHFTPKHGSWLNIAEIELSAFTNQCLKRRIGNINLLRKEAKAWYQERNKKQKSVNWQFQTQDARIKLERIYPQYQVE